MLCRKSVARVFIVEIKSRKDEKGNHWRTKSNGFEDSRARVSFELGLRKVYPRGLFLDLEGCIILRARTCI